MQRAIPHFARFSLPSRKHVRNTRVSPSSGRATPHPPCFRPVPAVAIPRTSEAMRILVTGVSGYVGAALVPRLRREGHACVASHARRRASTAWAWHSTTS
jgi:hypothetical protein